MFAVDPAPEVAREAAEWGADLLVVHHPLFLKPVHGVAATTPKGRTLATLVAGRVRAAHRAHQRRPGRRRRLGGARRGARPDRAGAAAAPVDDALDKLDRVRARRRSPRRSGRRSPRPARAGSATTTAASFTTPGEGRFRPLEGADPAIGEVGTARGRGRGPGRGRAAASPARGGRRGDAGRPPLRGAGVRRRRARPGRRPATGSGRIGDVAPTTLRGFAATVAEALPETAHGVRVAGDPDRPVRRVAVCGGAGDFLLDTVLRSDADVYVTSDLRHHPAAEFLEKDGPALVDVAHWAAEWTWLPVVRARLAEALGDTVETRVSTTAHRPLAVPPLKEPTLKADPFAQLKLLDVQELDSRADQLRHQRASLPELAEIAELEQSARRPGRPGPRRPDPRRRPHRRAEEGRRRRRAGQGPPQARPRPDGPGADHQPQGPRADAARAGVRWSAGSPRLEDDELEVMERLEEAQKDLDALTAQLAADRRAAGRPGRPPATRSSPALDEELARVDADRGPHGRGPARRPAGALRPAARAEGRRRCRPAARPRVRRLPADHRQRRARGHPQGARRRGHPLRGVPADPGAHPESGL